MSATIPSPGSPAARTDCYFPGCPARPSRLHCHSWGKVIPARTKSLTGSTTVLKRLLLTRANQSRALSASRRDVTLNQAGGGGQTEERVAQRGPQGRAARGSAQPASGWAPPPHPPPLPRFPQTRVQSVDLSSAAFLWSKVPPKFPSGQELVESLVFPLWLCAGVRPLAHAAPQLSTGVHPPPPPHRCSLLRACNSIIRVTPLGQRHQVSHCTLQGPRNPQSLRGLGQEKEEG